MAKFTATTPQTLAAVGDAVVWQHHDIPGCYAIFNRPGTAKVELAGGTHRHPVRYPISAHLNVTGVSGAISLGIYQDGEELPTSRMNVVAANAASVLSVDSTTTISAECCCSGISVKTLTAGVNILSAEINIAPPSAAKGGI